MRNYGLSLLTATLLLGFQVPWAAANPIIFNNGEPLLTAYGLPIADAAEDVLWLDDFQLAAGENILTDVHWWGTYFLNRIYDDNFTLSIWADDGGLPGSELYSQPLTEVERDLSDLNLTRYFWDLYEYDVEIDPIELLADTTYWLAIQNDAGLVNSSWHWLKSLDGFTGTTVARVDGAPWLPQDDELAFYLTGQVPLPSTITLILAGITLMARRRKVTERL